MKKPLVSTLMYLISTRYTAPKPFPVIHEKPPLYVLDGLLENNTILKIRAHTTDTHGYTEIIFALCYLLGFYFMPRIRDLKDQQLYRVERNVNYGTFTPLLNKTADLDIVEEQWDEMIHVASHSRSAQLQRM